MTEAGNPFRKVYGRGFFDGFKAAGIDQQGKNMNQAKFESIHRGQTVKAKKVLDATPKLESWSSTQIGQEMQRLGAGSVDLHEVRGCLNTLISNGLVREPKRGQFVRVEIRQKQEQEPYLVAVETKVEEPTPMQVVKEKPKDVAAPVDVTPIDRLSKLATRLRDLAADLDTAALDLAEQYEKADAETAKMRQLQALLKSLG